MLAHMCATYCPHIAQHVLILAIHLFDHLELFCRDRIRNQCTRSSAMLFFNENTSLLLFKLVLTLQLVILNGYNA